MVRNANSKNVYTCKTGKFAIPFSIRTKLKSSDAKETHINKKIDMNLLISECLKIIATKNAATVEIAEAL